MQRLSPLTLVTVLGGLLTTHCQAVDFAKQIFPILNSKCSSCHNEKKGKTKGDFAIDRKEDVAKQVKGGSPDASDLLRIITLPESDEDVMPPKGKGKVSASEVALIKQWITEGASLEAGGAAPAPASAPTPAAGGAQAWTNTAGKTLQAEFDRLEGDAVVVKATDGVYYKIPLANLSAASQAQAKKAGGQ